MESPPRIPFSKTTASTLLDATRGMAAFLVFLGHFRNLFYVSFPLLQVPHKMLLAPFYVMTSAGHQAVVIFFVLSGYLVGGSIFRMMDTENWTWRRYLTHRLVRLWLVLLPALLLGALWDSAGYYSHHAPALYTGHVPNHLGINILSTLNLRSFLGSAFFLQTIITNTFGTNGPLWSLANEFWYYILFPLALVACFRSFSRVTRIVCAALFVAGCLFVGRGIMELFPIWLLGAVLARIPLIHVAVRLRYPVWLLYPWLFFALSKLSAHWSLTSDYVLGLATFVFIASLLNMTGRAQETVWVRWARTSARFSYTLYLVHAPFLVFLAAFIIADRQWQVSPASVAAGTGVVAVTLLYAYAVAYITEFRTDAVRGWIEGLVLPGRRPGPARTDAEEAAAGSNAVSTRGI